MRKILLINPNSSAATTAMMVRIAAQHLPGGFEVTGVTAQDGPSMIVDEVELNASAAGVEQSWRAARADWDAVIVGAFGDPGIDRLRALCSVPVAGICEASMLEAAEGGRRFGVATVTPQLVAAIDRKAVELELGSLYTGVRLTDGEPRLLAADPAALEAALAEAVARCIDIDGAGAVIIGGGPLGQAAIGLAGRFAVPVIAPIGAAARWVVAKLGASAT